MTHTHPFRACSIFPRARVLIVTLLSSSLALTAPAFTAAGPAGQQTSPATTGSGAATNDEAVTLSPFTVGSDRDVGYIAGSALAGSRLKSRERVEEARGELRFLKRVCAPAGEA